MQAVTKVGTPISSWVCGTVTGMPLEGLRFGACGTAPQGGTHDSGASSASPCFN